jgi:hypothetical protein
MESIVMLLHLSPPSSFKAAWVNLKNEQVSITHHAEVEVEL